MRITCVTVSRGRAEAFALLEKWVSNQTRQPDRWLVLQGPWARDERGKVYDTNCGQELYRRRYDQHDGLDMLANWRHALNYITDEDECIVVLEDDDWYSPLYLETVERLFGDNDMIGFSYDLYYNLQSRKFVRMGNLAHASLAATAFRRGLFPVMAKQCKVQDVFVDLALWEPDGIAKGFKRQLWQNDMLIQERLSPYPLHIGIKCMPGPAGLGIGHRLDIGSFDPTAGQLLRWIGNDYREYLPYLGQDYMLTR